MPCCVEAATQAKALRGFRLSNHCGHQPAPNPKGFHVKNHSLAVRSVTIAAAAALSVAVAPIAPAQTTIPAAPIVEPGQAQTAGKVFKHGNVRVSNNTIDTSATGTLTIFKRANPKTTQNPTGEVVNPVPGDALAGAGFTLYKVTNADLSTNAGIAAASNLTVTTAKQGDAVEGEKTTGADGQAKWENLPVGVYILRETKTPAGYSPAADSLVFIPMTRENATNGGTQWLYDITAYPKNTSQQQPEKKVEDSGKNVGDTVKYTIDTWAQTVREGQYRTIYRIEDTLDAALDAANATVTVTPNTFTEGTDYSVTKNGQNIVVEFTEAGVKKIKNGQQISATIEAKVKENILTDGALTNKARQIQNNPNSNQKTKENETPNDTPEVKTYYGKINFKKVDGDHKALQGAEFQVYGTNEATCSNADANKDARQKANGKDTWTSGQDGTVTIEGLHANNIANMDSKGNTTPNKYTKYCLFETKSPSGFELLAEPLEFTLTASTDTNTVTASEIKVGNNAGEIVNLKDTTPKLPLTGGMGIGLLALLGGLIIAAGAFAAKRRSA